MSKLVLKCCYCDTILKKKNYIYGYCHGCDTYSVDYYKCQHDNVLDLIYLNIRQIYRNLRRIING